MPETSWELQRLSMSSLDDPQTHTRSAAKQQQELPQQKAEQTSKCWSSTTIKNVFIQQQKTHFPIDFLYALQPVKNKIKNGERGGKKRSVSSKIGGVLLNVCVVGLCER
jgi:hypothetical protein